VISIAIARPAFSISVSEGTPFSPAYRSAAYISATVRISWVTGNPHPSLSSRKTSRLAPLPTRGGGNPRVELTLLVQDTKLPSPHVGEGCRYGPVQSASGAGEGA